MLYEDVCFFLNCYFTLWKKRIRFRHPFPATVYEHNDIII